MNSNPCTRCGKERVRSRTWKEIIPTLSGRVMEIIHTDNICPDPDCQKIVEEKLNAQRKIKEKINKDREDRVKANLEKKKKLRINSG